MHLRRINGFIYTILFAWQILNVIMATLFYTSFDIDTRLLLDHKIVNVDSKWWIHSKHIAYQWLFNYAADQITFSMIYLSCDFMLGQFHQPVIDVTSDKMVTWVTWKGNLLSNEWYEWFVTQIAIAESLLNVTSYVWTSFRFQYWIPNLSQQHWKQLNGKDGIIFPLQIAY